MTAGQVTGRHTGGLPGGQVTSASKDWEHDQRAAVTAALTTRFYERFADQAVSVAKRLEFANTGDLPR